MKPEDKMIEPEQLKQVPIFACLTDARREYIAQSAAELHVQEGEWDIAARPAEFDPGRARGGRTDPWKFLKVSSLRALSSESFQPWKRRERGTTAQRTVMRECTAKERRVSVRAC
jgi:hypothetical protein